jgi:hypothetical protein
MNLIQDWAWNCACCEEIFSVGGEPMLYDINFLCCRRKILNKSSTRNGVLLNPFSHIALVLGHYYLTLRASPLATVEWHFHNTLDELHFKNITVKLALDF